jgi:O-antigen ligase
MSAPAPPASPVEAWLAGAFVFGATVLPYVGGFPLAYALMLLAVVLTVRWGLTLRRDSWVLEPAAVMFALAYLLLAVAFLANARDAEDAGTALNFLLLLIFYPLVLMLRHARPGNGALRVAIGCLAGVLLALGVALVQRGAFGFVLATGALSDSLWAASSVVVVGFVGLAGVRADSGGAWRLLCLAAPVVALVVALLAGARGPLLAYPPALVLAALLIPRSRWASLLLLLGAAAVAALAVAALAMLSPVTAERLWRLVVTSGQLLSGEAITDASMSIRWSLLQGGLDAFRASPWLGYGWGHFGEATAPYAGQFDLAERAGQYHLHNDIASFAVAGGVLGLAAYGLIIAAPLVGALLSPRDSQRRSRVIAATMLVVTYLFCGLTNAMLGFEFLTTLYVALTAIILGYCRDPEPGPRR